MRISYNNSPSQKHHTQERKDSSIPDQKTTAPDLIPTDPISGNETPVQRRKAKVTSYRVRKGSISPQAAERYAQLWPRYGLSLAELPGSFAPIFTGEMPLVLDIGPGTGISTITMALQEKDTTVIAAEVYTPGLMKIATALAENDISHVRLVQGDALEVLEKHIPSGRLIGIRVFFPDPWPKKRHHKRRLLSRENLQLMGEKLHSGGILHIATDHAGYAEFIEANIAAQTSLHPVNQPEHSPILLERPCTKFEARGIALDHTIKDYYLIKP